MIFKRKHTGSLSDQELIELYRTNGNKQVVGELYERHMSYVLGISMNYLKSLNQSEDAVMEIFEKLMVDLLNHEVKHFKSWLYMVTKNYCLQLLRKQNKEPFLEKNDALLENFMENGEEEHLTVKEQELNSLEECMKTLKEEQQKCVELFFWHEFSYKEISTQTRFDVKKVKSFIQNAKRNLKNCMEQVSIHG